MKIRFFFRIALLISVVFGCYYLGRLSRESRIALLNARIDSEKAKRLLDRKQLDKSRLTRERIRGERDRVWGERNQFLAELKQYRSAFGDLEKLQEVAQLRRKKSFFEQLPSTEIRHPDSVTFWTVQSMPALPDPVKAPYRDCIAAVEAIA